MMLIYSNGDALEAEKKGMIIGLSLGNLGFSRYICTSSFPTIEEEVMIACRTGEFQTLKYIGLLPDKPGIKSTSGNIIRPDYCGDPTTISAND